MSLNVWSNLPPSAPSSSNAAVAPPLLALTYRSRASAPMSASDLQRLKNEAAARNKAEDVTGLVIYDDQRFFQWIEGPPGAVGRVWNSISRDPRHADIEGLSLHAASFRLFAQWDLKLSTNGQELSSLALPMSPEVDATAQRLARLAISADGEDARTLLHDAFAEWRSIPSVTEQLVEPAARCLGDLWSADDCDEYEMTLGLCRLQSYMRDLCAGAQPTLHARPLVVLVAPLPGELHLLGASLGAESTWQAGWETHVRFPNNAEALNKIVSKKWFDALDLTLSPSLLREHRLPNMEQIIASVRRASRNPALVVVTGGRAFFERSSGADVGADASHTSATNLVEAVEQVYRDRQ